MCLIGFCQTGYWLIGILFYNINGQKSDLLGSFTWSPDNMTTIGTLSKVVLIVTWMRCIYFTKCNLVLKQEDLIARVVLILSEIMELHCIILMNIFLNLFSNLKIWFNDVSNSFLGSQSAKRAKLGTVASTHLDASVESFAKYIKEHFIPEVRGKYMSKSW